MSTKKVFAGLLCALVVTGSSIPVFAQTTLNQGFVQGENLATPRFAYVAGATSTLSISGSTAQIKGTVKMTSAGKSVSMTTSLLCDGEVIKSWSTPVTTSTQAMIQKSVKLTAKGTYQVETEYTVYGDTGSESGVASSKSVNY